MMTRLAALLLVTAPATFAQQPPEPHPFQAPAASADRLLFDDVDGVVWARGYDYKASFSRSGSSFIPFLGSTAPENYPVHLQLDRVSVGGEAVELEPAASPVRSGERVTIDHGPVAEIYAVAPTQVEQMFRIDRPLGRGDLVVRVAVTTDLQVAAVRGGGFEFTNQLGGVRYGKAEVFDARGSRASMRSVHRDGAIELTVPAAFMDTAVFPVTIDPVLVSFAFTFPPINGALTPEQNLSADVAYDESTDTYMVTWETIFSAADHDVYVVKYVKQSIPSSGAIAIIDNTTFNWSKPKIANNSASNQFMVVAERTLSGGVVVIGARTVFSASLSMSAQLQVSSAETGNKSNPDVGGDNSGEVPTYYCVTWQNTTPSGGKNLYYRLVTTNGFVLTSKLLGTTSGVQDSLPSISKTNGTGSAATRDWIVVWQRTAGISNEDIHGAVIHWDGTAVSSEFAIDTSSAHHTRPQVSTVTDNHYGSRRWMVVYQELQNAGPFGIINEDIIGQVFAGTTPVASPVNLTTLLNAPASDDQLNPCVDSDGTRFVVGYSQQAGPFAADKGIPFAATLHLERGTTLGVTEFPIALNLSPGPEDFLQITAARGASGTAMEYLLVWDGVFPPTGERSIHGAVWNGWSGAANGGPATYFNHNLPGCGGLAITLAGFPALGEKITITLDNVQGIPALLLGTPTPPLSLCASCQIGIDLATAIAISTRSLVLSIPSEGTLVNAFFGVQGVDLGSTTGCTVPLTLSVSDKVIVTLL